MWQEVESFAITAANILCTITSDGRNFRTTAPTAAHVWTVMRMAKFPTTEEFTKQVADLVVDELEYEGKTIRKWIELILSGKLVDVVRCKDCRYARINENHPNKPLICRLTKMCGTTNPEWYCADGERRSGE